VKGLAPAQNLTRDSRTNTHEELVELVGRGLWHNSLSRLPAPDHLTHVAKDGGRTLPPHPTGDVAPDVAPDGRLNYLIKGEEGKSPAIPGKKSAALRHEPQSGARGRGGRGVVKFEILKGSMIVKNRQK